MRIRHILILAAALGTVSACVGCTEIEAAPKGVELINNGVPENNPNDVLEVYPLPGDGTQVPVSTHYTIRLIQGSKKLDSPVFVSECPVFELGKENMVANDENPLRIFKDQSISWTGFSFNGEVKVEVTVIDPTLTPTADNVKILPSRHGITPEVKGNVISFSLKNPGQFSVEIGANGYKQGLVVFADPAQSDVPEQDDANYLYLDGASAADLASAASYKGVYFKKGVHDIGLWNVPSGVKNIYFEGGAYVYGSLRFSGSSDVRIFGRGILSQGRMNYREAHSIEAVDGSNRITLEGITVACNKYFSVRLIGTNNIVKWTKVIGGWTYNADGISAYANSTVSNCFIWANDDSIKCYETGVSFSDIVVWQLNNGGAIQFNWGNGKCDHAEIRRVDILHAFWNSDAKNRGVISCVGNKYYYERGGIYTSYYGWSKNLLVEDLVTETPMPLIINMAPYDYSPLTLDGFHFKDWKISWSGKYGSKMIGIDADHKIKNVIFENISVNGTKLTQDNFRSVLSLTTDNFEEPIVK